MSKTSQPPSLAESLKAFRENYARDYTRELESCDRWIKWCEEQNDTHGMNFHQGKQSAHIYLDITIQSLLRSLQIIVDSQPSPP